MRALRDALLTRENKLRWDRVNELVEQQLQERKAMQVGINKYIHLCIFIFIHTCIERDSCFYSFTSMHYDETQAALGLCQ